MMIVRAIIYHPNYIKTFSRLEQFVQHRTVKAEALFRSNPLHPSLRLHPLKGDLKGLWSLSVTVHIRIIFKRMEKGEIVFLSIGQHDLYRSL